MNKNWQLLALLIVLVLLAGGIIFLSQHLYSNQLTARVGRSNPVSIFIKREIKTDLYTPSQGPAPLTGWEMSGVGNSNREGLMQTRTTASSRSRKPAPADSLQSGRHEQTPDSLASVHRDSAASR